ncbi:hypothetical protein LEB14_01080 [Salmonella enterica]|uniref:hypothetical protein n=1 Tax=Salmonella enterica TaxID=28901 RepID=UPI0015FBE8C4|nr:hypothetical protein [Salmonella enterica]MDJ3479451.1 hypothetical protein [Salmonella enterica]QMW52752.1 hypothetical protein H4F89_20480 [Salmonella enterica subsp. diarizonae serovar b,50:-:-]
MFGKLLKGIAGKIQADFRRSLRNNEHYKKNRWNLLERVQVYCSTHYLKAMLFLWVTAGGAVMTAEILRPILLPYARQHFNGASALTGWMSSMLGSQVTLIGIVFPLVVGLISVLFQKKSSRIHIQSAYQLHSGYMFSGLSGLSLAAFILIGGLFLALGDKYLNTVFSVTAFFWMIFNILLSMRFFISSLNVLDDEKRDRLMLKYFHSQIVSPSIQESLIWNWMQFPGAYIDGDRINGITILPYYEFDKDDLFLFQIKMNREQVVKDVYLRPLLFLLRRLRPLPDVEAKIVLLPSWGTGNNKISVLAYSGVNPSVMWLFLFKLCFHKGTSRRKTEYRNITRDFYGEVYDTLQDKNISSFEIATSRLVKVFTSLKNGFSYNEGNYLDECNIVNNYVTFSDSFHTTFWEFCHETIKTAETSGEYFRRVMDIPSSIYRSSEGNNDPDFQQFIRSLFAMWHALINWRAGYGENLSISQSQRHRELVVDFIGEWEIWNMGLHKAEVEQDKYANCLLHHLCYAPRIVMLALTAGDRFATDHATDMLLLWLNQTSMERAWEAEHLWHSYFLTPCFLDLPVSGKEWRTVLKNNPYSRDAAYFFIFSNALVDLRLLVIGYILTSFESQKNEYVNEVISRLLNSELAFPTGTHENMTDKFINANDIIDGIIRLEYRTYEHGNDWYKMLTEMINSFSFFNERQQVTGRIYMGAREDVRDMYASIAEIGILLSSTVSTVSCRVKKALTDNLFSYHNKQQILHRLQGLKREASQFQTSVLLSHNDYEERVVHFNVTLDAYIDIFSQSVTEDVILAKEDTKLIRNNELMLTEKTPRILAEHALFSHFNLVFKEGFNTPLETMIIRTIMSKVCMAQGINTDFSRGLTPLSKVKALMLKKLYHLVGNMPIEYSEDINSTEEFCKKILEITSGKPEFTLIIFGTKFARDLRDLIHHRELHDVLGITINDTSRESGALPFKINNCTVYEVWGSEDNHTLLVRNNSFSELRMFRYPDGSLFTTFWRISDETPLEGTLYTVWDPEIEVTGSVVARINH